MENSEIIILLADDEPDTLELGLTSIPRRSGRLFWLDILLSSLDFPVFFSYS